MINRLDADRLQPNLIRVALVAAALAALIFAFQWQFADRRASREAVVATLSRLAQGIPLQAGAAVRGSAPAFDSLATSRAQLESRLDDASRSGEKLPGGDENWLAMLEQSQAVLDGRAAALDTRKVLASVRELTPQVLAATANVAKAMGASRPEAFNRQLDRFEVRAQAIEQDLAALADGTTSVEAASRRLAESLEFMGQVVGGLVGESNPLGIVEAQGPAADAARLLSAVFRSEQQQVRSVMALGDPLEQLQAAGNALVESGGKAAAALPSLGSSPAARSWFMSPWLPLALLLLAILALALLAFVQRSLATQRRATDLQAVQNERNQQAILRLLDELSSLADGDLTVQATVTEDITGAIADSINYAIEALRELVTTINHSAIKLDTTTRQTQALSTHLAKASAAQSNQIGAASESIAEMAASTEEVSGNAERSADVARHSVDIAHKGGDAVRRTIDGMNAIRENIQETSKRIKRLGESSQEIGNIVELINDIAEQTNILALNASIQASMAGEAGRGFAVVADEVQRLAERAANATRQIEVLVRTIQADTNEAVVSMERTTTDVVGGALLAENAGAALEEIEQVSNQIASLVQNISASARHQATSSQSISRNMQVLREISSQTAESTTATSDSIGKLAELATQLRKSVTGFRLPEGAGASVSGEYPMLRPEALAADEVARLRRVGGERADDDERAPVTTGTMLAGPDEGRASLQIVAGEVTTELNEAQAALEAFSEHTSDRAALHRFIAHLHVGRGALRLAEVYGGALLGEEMEQVARFIDGHASDATVDADALDALMRAMEQLPAYVDRVASGGRDVPLALLPLLNDLRAVRGSALLSEGTLLLLNLRSDEPAHPADVVRGQTSIVDLARRLRPRFQLALLGWIRGEHFTETLGALADIAHEFERAATAQPLFQLWWVVGAVIEALQQGGIDANVSVKRLLGNVDREIRRLQEQGEASYASSPPVELLNNLLFYVARSASSGARVSSVRRSFRLGEVLASGELIDVAPETLSAPSVRLMKTVAAAIREDLTRVKDVLDIFVRRGATQVDELAPQLEMLRKIGDTLGVLGLGALRNRVQGEIDSLMRIVERREPPGDAALLDIAAALIEVEDGLDPQLVKLILPEGARESSEPGEPTNEEFRQVQDAVLRECIVNMARIKEAVTHALGAPSEAQGLDQVPQLVRGITAGLLMLGRNRAVETMEGVGRALASIVRPDAEALEPQRLDCMADAIVAVEYYMEMLQAGRSDPWFVLEAAESCLEGLDREPPAGAPVAVPDSAEATLESSFWKQAPATGVPGVEVAAPAAASAPAEAPARTQAPTPEIETGADPEFVQLFAEEARESILVLQELFPKWEQNPLDIDSLRDLRRVFHTLKGSGRMVGARRVSEFSWSIESTLNRVISQTLLRSPEVVAVVRDAVAVLPSLVDELEHGSETPVDVSAIAARADTLSGREAAAFPPPAPQPAPAPEPEENEPDRGEAPAFPSEPVGMDPVLRDIFRKETAGHIGVVRDFIARCAEAVAPFAVTEALYRACHTLSGIAKTAGARQGIKVAEPMEHYVRKLHDNGRGLPDEGLLLLRDTVLSLENVVANVEEDTGFFPDHGRLIAGWHALERALDAELARLADAGERTLGDGWERETPGAGATEHDLTEPDLLMPVLPSDMPLPPEEFSAPFVAPVVQQQPVEASGTTAPDESEPEFDADIAAIFGEEAIELLELADSSLADWIGDRADRSRVTELKRVLHTLKGGARMAGIRAMGDLSHEMESFLGSLESGAVAADESAVRVLQAALDELHGMREAVNAGQPIAAARELIERVHAVVMASAAQDSASVVQDVAPPAPPELEAAVPATEIESWPAAPGEMQSPVSLEEISMAEVFAATETSAEQPIHLPAADEPEREPWVDGKAMQEVEPQEVATHEVETREFEAHEVPVHEVIASEPSTPAAHFVLPGREPAAPPERNELARVNAVLLDELLNNSGEVSIFRARVEQQMTSTEFNLAELGRTVTRLREQLRKLELETEAQILFKHQADAGGRADFDPLELDRYSTIQQLSRALAESVSDVASIESLLESVNREGQNLLQQQGRVIADLQNGLMRTRMVPFQRHAQRLTRLVRQAAQETGKKAELEIEGGGGEIDRQVLERMLPPFEHMLRNAVVHGIELPEERLARGKEETGRIAVRLQREGAEVVITVEDDGAGLDIEAIRAKARQMGLLRPGQELTDEEALQLVLEPGFSTAQRLTQQAGRGVGMDVVATEVKRLGGGLFIESTPARGARFTIRLPFTLAITQALIVRTHDEFYALPVATVEGVARIPATEIRAHLTEDQPTFEYGGHLFRFQHLGSFLGSGPSELPETDVSVPVILVRAGEHSTALVTDELIGSREIVVKSVGPQVASVRGISGATILGDGRIVIILDMGALVRSEWRSRAPDVSVRTTRDDRIFALVVDDSITVRRVTQRFLERNGMRVMTAKDGVEAMALLQEHTPDVILLDIEMPRMDGYEVASHVRNDARLADIPIIMITSRVGDKHRARAIELGVDDYLGKPYQESQLLDAIEPLVLARRRQLP